MSNRYAVAQRANVPPFHVMDLLAAADQRRRTHGDLVNLVAGQPSTGAPAPVKPRRSGCCSPTIPWATRWHRASPSCAS